MNYLCTTKNKNPIASQDMYLLDWVTQKIRIANYHNALLEISYLYSKPHPSASKTPILINAIYSSCERN